ncbi:MAG: LysR substrate-binding domain-containing protein [Rikenellaceae bacterium]|nr:LysR substrate-binding domain-containing protein [Rikenellaceae bacterium]MCL2692780.1 LysR substrate-binding domain-containing protein [Rikenellaceae bacterium]
MTIIQLEYLIAVANYGSFSLAAEHCFVTQPSLSMQIKNLEEELGVVLLDRTKKPVIPTMVGRVVIENARQAIRAFNYVKESVNEIKGEVSGALNVGVIPSISPYLVHRFLPDFITRYPKITLEIREMKHCDIVAALQRDALDAAILSGGTSPEGITEHELFNDRFFAYVSPQSPLYGRANIRIEDIDARRLLLPGEGNCLRDQILELFQIKGSDCSPFDCGSLETLIRIVDCTAQMTIIPEMALDFITEERRGQVKPLAKGATSRKITIAVRRTYVKGSLVDALRESIMRIVAAG